MRDRQKPLGSSIAPEGYNVVRCDPDECLHHILLGIAYANEGRRRKVGKVIKDKRRRKLTRVKKTPKVYCNIPDHFLVPLAV